MDQEKADKNIGKEFYTITQGQSMTSKSSSVTRWYKIIGEEGDFYKCEEITDNNRGVLLQKAVVSLAIKRQ